MSRSTSKQCAGVRRDGRPCTGPAMGAERFCFAHDPTQAEARKKARSRGGHARSSSARLRGLVPPRLLSVYDTLEAALLDVRDGKLDPRQAGAMAALARAMVAVLTSGELEQRLREMEARLGAAQRPA